jgi:primosomal protein N' (replication factor Y)
LARIAAIAQVEPLTTARSLRGPFDYSLPEALAGVDVGSLLVVPFGRRRVLGVVTGLAERTDVPPERLVAPLEALELGVPPELVRLASWMAAEYCSTPARALSLVLPPGAAAGMRERRALVAELTEAGRAVAGGVAGPDNGSSGEGLAGGRGLVNGSSGDELAGGGSLARGPVPAGPRLGVRQQAALSALSGGPLPAAEVPGGHGTLRRLEARGLVTVAIEVRGRRPVNARVGVATVQPPALTGAQAAALAPVAAAIADGRGERFLLHGVTGSGKTEVYLRATAAALERGRGAIVLVPEIALTPQIVARFEARFGPTVAVLHSGLGEGERHDEWLRLRRGEARVCVGPRSAVFAPVADLGLVVVDEEHESSYKHEGDPRYDARRVAERRAADAGAVLLMGSATPRPESVGEVLSAGPGPEGIGDGLSAGAASPGESAAIRRLRLSERVDGRPLPPVELLDMRDVREALHPRAFAALEAVRRAQSKAIVLLNRRGWSNFLTCRSCGRVWECPDCDVALVLHRAQGAMACHHCGHRRPAPQSCDACGSISVARHGVGTERLEAELAGAFGGDAAGRSGFPVFRLDADSASGRGAAGDLLAAFEAAPSGVLVGTQMVAKGHDFPDVTLGLVLDADSTLRFPDFRAEERTFALVTQLAGRAGRGPGGGSVLVQTLDPGAPSLVRAADHDADGFLAEELARREALGYPPYADLIRVVCGSPEPGAAARAAAAVRAGLEIPRAAILGPAPLFRLRGRERAQIVIKARDRAPAVRAVGAAVEAVAADRAHRAATFSVDVDPQ